MASALYCVLTCCYPACRCCPPIAGLCFVLFVVVFCCCFVQSAFQQQELLERSRGGTLSTEDRHALARSYQRDAAIAMANRNDDCFFVCYDVATPPATGLQSAKLQLSYLGASSATTDSSGAAFANSVKLPFEVAAVATAQVDAAAGGAEGGAEGDGGADDDVSMAPTTSAAPAAAAGSGDAAAASATAGAAAGATAPAVDEDVTMGQE